MEGVTQLAVRDAPGGALLAVKVVPGASRDKVTGVLGDRLKITTSAPPERGKANQAVARALARCLGVDLRDVRLVSGTTSPAKEFRIAGLSAKAVRQALADA